MTRQKLTGLKKRANKLDGGKARAKKQMGKLRRKAAKEQRAVPNERPVPMSINSPCDNAAAWLDDEPWRTW